MRADKLSTYVLYLWLFSCFIAIVPLVYSFLLFDEFHRSGLRKLIGAAISLIIPTTGLAFSRMLVDREPSRRHIRKHLIPVVYLGVVSAPFAIFITSLVYVLDQVPNNTKLFDDASLILPVSTAAMFYVFGVAIKE